MRRPLRLATVCGAALLASSYSAEAIASEPTGAMERQAEEPSSSVPPATSTPVGLPPPRWTGTTLFITGAVTATAGFVLHGLAAKGVSDNCVVVEDPLDLLPSQVRALDIGDALDATFLANIDMICSARVGLALGARLLVPMFSLGAIAQITVGGALRGDHLAYRDALDDKRRHSILMAGFGGALVVGGTVLWAVSRAAIAENRTSCDTPGCLAWFDFGTLQGSTILAMAGSGMLAQALTYRRRRPLYRGVSEVRLSPSFARQRLGLSLAGRF